MTGRQEELIAGWLDVSLTADEQAELLEALQTDEAFARGFAGEVEIHRGLQFSASQSEEGDRRAADRILHYVRASHEGTKFVENVKQRAVAGSRRHVPHPGTSLFGPVVAIAAVLMVAMLVGLLAFVSHRHKMAARPEFAEGRGRGRGKARPCAERRRRRKPVEDEAARRKRIEEELRTAAGEQRVETLPEEPTRAGGGEALDESRPRIFTHESRSLPRSRGRRRPGRRPGRRDRTPRRVERSRRRGRRDRPALSRHRPGSPDTRIELPAKRSR
jgi:hypothetical protein